MKNVLMILMFMLGVSISGVAQTTQVENVINDIKVEVKNAPKGTVYGLTKTTKEYYLVNTPIGEYRIDRNPDNSFSFMGVKVKLVSSKNNVYVVNTSLGDFEINPKKVMVKKIKNNNSN